MGEEPGEVVGEGVKFEEAQGQTREGETNPAECSSDLVRHGGRLEIHTPRCSDQRFSTAGGSGPAFSPYCEVTTQILSFLVNTFLN